MMPDAAWQCVLWFLLAAPNGWDDSATDTWLLPRDHEDLVDGLRVLHAGFLLYSNMMQDSFLNDFLVPLRLCSQRLCRLVTNAFDDMKSMPRTIEVSPLRRQLHALQLVVCDLSIVAFNLGPYLEQGGWGASLAWLLRDVRLELHLAGLRHEYPQHVRDLVHLGQADTFTWRLLKLLIRSFWDDDAYDNVLSRRAQCSIEARIGLRGLRDQQ